MNNVPTSAPVELAFRPRRVLLWVFLVCVLSEAAFFLLDWHVNYGRLIDASPIRNLFNTTREDGMASWFGVTQTALIALTLWLIFITTRARGDGRWVVLGWMVLALFFSYMAFDDGSEFHERIGSTFKIMQKQAAGDGGVLKLFPSYPWQVIFVPIFGTFGLFMLVFLWRQLGERFPRLLVLAGIGSLALAVGIDFVEGLDEDHALNVNSMIAGLPGVDEYTRERFNRKAYLAVRHFGKSVEETLEMFAMTLLWIVFLRHWMLISGELRVRFEEPDPGGGP